MTQYSYVYMCCIVAAKKDPLMVHVYTHVLTKCDTVHHDTTCEVRPKRGAHVPTGARLPMGLCMYRSGEHGRIKNRQNGSTDTMNMDTQMETQTRGMHGGNTDRWKHKHRGTQ